jgi:hypothetical protein
VAAGAVVRPAGVAGLGALRAAIGATVGPDLGALGILVGAFVWPVVGTLLGPLDTLVAAAVGNS